MKPLVPLALAVAFTGCRNPVPTPPAPQAPATRIAPENGRVTAISLPDLFQRQQAGEVLIYDVRPVFVAAFGTIPGAISWPRGDFDRRLSRGETEIRAARAAGKPVVLYCTDAACPDSRAVAEKLAARGHDVAVFEGGFAAWKEAGLTTE